ncbi:MAG: alkaline phosphatase family protein [Actinomycetota bacterium]
MRRTKPRSSSARVWLRVGAALAVSAGLAGFMLLRPGDETAASRLAGPARIFDSDDPIDRACDLDADLLRRIWLGTFEPRSEDVVMVPQEPNYTGTFDIVNHSGPWDYLSRVPLVLYGPRIAAQGPVDTPAELVDVFPTVGALTGVTLEERSGRVLDEALTDSAGRPRLIVTLVWDGAGRNVLERWPDEWPFLAGLERRGTSYREAFVGSSPTITPSIHTTLGTGTHPNEHGVTGIYYRDGGGRIVEAFRSGDPSAMRTTTFADEIDRALGNEPKVGLIGWRTWQLGMLGHGAALDGADADEVALFRKYDIDDHPEAQFQKMPGTYSAPGSLAGYRWSRLTAHAESVDDSDGERDGAWLGNPIFGEYHDNPVWVRHETDAILRMLEGGDYGRDDVTDLLFANLKVTDTVGHRHTMDSPEMRGAVRALDDSLRDIVGYLDREVGDYVVILTADHGHTPSPRRSGGWPINNDELVRDLDVHFEVPEGRSIVADSIGVGLFLNFEVMRDLAVTEEDVVGFLLHYTIGDNWDQDRVPTGYEERAGEHVFAAVWGRSQQDEVMTCALGGPTPTPSPSG